MMNDDAGAPAIDVDLSAFLEPVLNQRNHHQSTKQRNATLLLHAHGLVEWLLAHHFPSKIRKSPYPVVIISPSRGRIRIQPQLARTRTLNITNTANEHNHHQQEGQKSDDRDCESESYTKIENKGTYTKKGGETVRKTPPSSSSATTENFDGASWEKAVHSALKKITVEDLGYMNAAELKASIPDNDSEGRGKTDLYQLEKKLSVKVVFDDGGAESGESGGSGGSGGSGHVLLVGDAKKLEKKVFVIRNMLSHYHWRLSGSDVAFEKKGTTSTA